MGKAERGQVAVLLCKGGQTGDDHRELGKEEVQTLTKEDQVGVADVSSCRRKTHSVT